MTQESEELRELANDTAEALAQLITQPEAWNPFVVYFLECLELEAMRLDPQHPEAVELFYARLGDALADRLQAGRWQE